MTEAFRTLKPGAHILVWAIPRTSHWTATAIENANFEIRDVVTHIFGSGFPKSQNISKAIDKHAGVKRKVVGVVKNTYDGSKRVPSKHVPPNQTDTTGKWGLNESPHERPLTEAATKAAKQWDGWGTALKPASEHWILARKPLSEKTIVANVLEHGTGGINIDASRITLEPNSRLTKGGSYSGNRTGSNTSSTFNGGNGKVEYTTPPGRFPANLILSHQPGCKQVGTKEGKGYTINRFTDGAKPFGDGAGHPYEVEDQGPETIAVWDCEDDCAVKQLDDQSIAGGMHTTGRKRTPNNACKQTGEGGMFGMGNHERNGVRFGDKGGASRFFYCPKASKKRKP